MSIKQFINSNYTEILCVYMLICISACTSHTTETAVAVDDPDFNNITREQFKHISLDTAKLLGDESELLLTGRISFDENFVVKVFPLVSGKVLKVNASLGDKVHKGEVLAVLRSAEISDLQNQYSIALSTQALAKKNVDIDEQLYISKVVSERDYLNAQNDYKKTTGDVNRIKEQLAIFGANDNTVDAMYRIIAPNDGYVVEKNVNESMDIRSDNSNNIFTVSSLSTVWVIGSVYEKDISKIALNENVDITVVAYPDTVFKSKIEQIGSLLDPETKTLKVRMVLDNSSGLLKPDMFATVNVHILKNHKTVSVPSSSIVFDRDKYYIMVMKNDTTYERRLVELGATIGKRTYIEKGLNAKEIVVTDGSLLVENN